jgi:hypothetical protein
MPLSVRVDLKTERVIERLARTKGQTKSEVIREAIAALAHDKNGAAKSGRPYQMVQDLIGCVKGGPPDLSVRTGEKLQRLLAQRGKR